MTYPYIIIHFLKGNLVRNSNLMRKFCYDVRGWSFQCSYVVIFLSKILGILSLIGCLPTPLPYFKVGVGYTWVKNTFLDIFLRAQFFSTPFSLSQHKITKFLVSGPRKKCARPKSKMAAISLKNHIFSHNFAILGSFLLIVVSNPMFWGSSNLFMHIRRAINDW